ASFIVPHSHIWYYLVLNLSTVVNPPWSHKQLWVKTSYSMLWGLIEYFALMELGKLVVVLRIWIRLTVLISSNPSSKRNYVPIGGMKHP
ncbi:MAG: hypothetical protein ACUVXA_20300, partial [Candidatus Jordarchaeum sp.]|uniref:hypothetical protein n=1 Tax=Candidatus Jordarchaeum sp. TaxID=2823881 RepID=UPI00404B756F